MHSVKLICGFGPLNISELIWGYVLDVFGDIFF